jgi:hypothetical protein
MKLNGDDLTYTIKVLGGEVPQAGETPSLFIDWWRWGWRPGPGQSGAGLALLARALRRTALPVVTRNHLVSRQHPSRPSGGCCPAVVGDRERPCRYSMVRSS